MSRPGARERDLRRYARASQALIDAQRYARAGEWIEARAAREEAREAIRWGI